MPSELGYVPLTGESSDRNLQQTLRVSFKHEFCCMSHAPIQLEGPRPLQIHLRENPFEIF